MTAPKPPPDLGRLVKAARKSRGLTLAALAERSGVSRSMLSAIERGTVNPTFSVVWTLTQSLGIDFNTLDRSASVDDPIEYQPRYSTPVRRSADGKCRLYMLGPSHTVLPIEWHDVHFEPGGLLDSAAHAPGTFEHLTCLAGVLSVTIGDVTVRADSGDTLRYRADQPYTIRNEQDQTSRALLLIALPSQYMMPRGV